MNHKWIRRTITISLLCLATILIVGLFPLAGVLFFLVDLVHNRRFPLLRAYLLIMFYCVWELFGVVAAFCVWLFSRLCFLCSHNCFINWNYALQRWWVRGFALAGQKLFTVHLHLTEDDLSVGDRRFIVLVRHTSLADTILVTYLLRVMKDFRLRYVMKKELLWDPCLDIVGNRLPNYFVDRASSQMHHEVESIARLADNLDVNEGVILWPEATRYSPAKKERALARLQESGEQELFERAQRFRQVLPPKTTGIIALRERNPELDVILCAHAGFEHAASFKEIFRGILIGQEIRARLWYFHSEEIPQDRRELTRWIYDKWMLVDDFVVQSFSGDLPLPPK